MADQELVRSLEKAFTAHCLDGGIARVLIRVTPRAAGSSSVYAISVSPDATWCFESLFQRVFRRQPTLRDCEYLLEEREVVELTQREPYFSPFPRRHAIPLDGDIERRPLG